MKRTCTSLMLAGSMLAGGQAMAGDLLLWQTNSLTYLYGKNFAINPSIQQTVTFEHASGWSFGDLFIFVDGIKYNTEATNGAGDGHKPAVNKHAAAAGRQGLPPRSRCSSASPCSPRLTTSRRAQVQRCPAVTNAD